MDKITIDSRLLKGMMAAAPKNDIRYYLNGIHIKGDVIEVTNGHYLFRSKLDERYTEITFSLIGAIPKSARESELDFSSCCAVHRNGKRIVVGSSYINVVDGKYPDTEEPISRFETKRISSVGFNPEYTSMPYRLFNADGAKFEFGGTNKTSRITFADKDDHEIEMYIMPMRLD